MVVVLRPPRPGFTFVDGNASCFKKNWTLCCNRCTVMSSTKLLCNYTEKDWNLLLLFRHITSRSIDDLIHGYVIGMSAVKEERFAHVYCHLCNNAISMVNVGFITPANVSS